MTDPKNALLAARETSRAALADMMDSLTAVRDQIRTLNQQKKEIGSAPVPLSVALERVDECVGLYEKAFQASLPASWEFTRHDYRTPLLNLDKALTAIMSGKIVDALKQRVTEAYEQDRSLSEADRSAKLRNLDRQLLDNELVEESIIRAANTAGLQIVRRAEADPRAVLAHDKALP